MAPNSSTAAPVGLQTTDATTITERYHTVRQFSETLCEPLETEDYVVQTMESVSPTKWHLAHTSWFFETFVLRPHLDGYEPIDEQYAYLFNSYYIQAGERHCRDRRGYISRPTVAEVYAFRHHVDEHVDRLLTSVDAAQRRELAPLVELGIHHEQQHQELMLTDIKHVFSVNPLRPAYRDLQPPARTEVPELGWTAFEEGVYEVGYDGDGFHYDNETPRHKTYVQPFELANRLVTNGEFIAFIEDQGYQRPELWLSEGWSTVQERDWTEPFYWEQHDGQWYLYTLGGMREVNPGEPLTHITYFEAEAYARWAGARLPEEEEWEIAARSQPMQGNFVDEGRYHPVPLAEDANPDELHQLYGDVWEWTRSTYSPYPGYKPLPGAIGEYNGKFMCGQFVLRGGSCATSHSHIRPTYRTFFHPDEAWQFTGFRLARDPD